MKKATKKTAAATKKNQAKKKSPAVKRAAGRAANRRKLAIRPRADAGKKRADIERLGDLPRSYGEDGIFVIAQDPHRLFCYWDYALADKAAGQIFLRHGRDTRHPEGEVEVPAEANNWYLSVREADADYVVELGHYPRGRWKTLARSAAVLTPRDAPSGLGEALFANMPFRNTFGELVGKLRAKMRKGESLAEAVARLQVGSGESVAHLGAAGQTAMDSILRAGLGSLTSGDLGRFMSSPGASLFSAGFAPSSRAGVSSWTQAPGEIPGGFLESMGLSGASWASAPWSAVGGSWSMAASSWSSPGSSPSRQPAVPRGFFMHVNAEVIFYGGTHPDATVTIDGKPVALRPDGTFRHHFVFPDGEFEIPIVATSPDGVETRRAVLKFERATARQDSVGATAQPPLGTPPGGKK